MPLTRRSCLKTFALGTTYLSRAESNSLSMPGQYRGKVVAVEHPGSIVAGKYQAEPIRAMVRRGMEELTGGTWAEAWRRFFQPGDVVGIKVNPVGQPNVISSPETMHAILEGLAAAGIPNRDIVVYDRYRDQFEHAGFAKWLPGGVRTSYAAQKYDDIQQSIEGYDPDHYVDIPLTMPGYDVSNLTARRSFASRFITRQVNKLVNLAVLKDHQSAGVTLALKNMSHGLVNNVCRSHSTTTANACGLFIPAVVSMPVIRNKAVLHILDGIKGCYHGGPGARPQYCWEHRTLYFATDPVALDRTGWQAIDRQRVSVGMKPIADDTPDQVSTFLHRQPEHIELAGDMGLGEWDLSKISLRRVRLA